MKCGFGIAGGQRAGASGRRGDKRCCWGGKPGPARLAGCIYQSSRYYSVATTLSPASFSVFLFLFLDFML